MYPGSVTSKKAIEWGYFSDDDDDWKVVDKSSMKDEVEDLEKIVGFVGKLCFFAHPTLLCSFIIIFSSLTPLLNLTLYEFFVQNRNCG